MSLTWKAIMRHRLGECIVISSTDDSTGRAPDFRSARRRACRMPPLSAPSFGKLNALATNGMGFDLDEATGELMAQSGSHGACSLFVAAP
jgi:hypothetical protein